MTNANVQVFQLKISNIFTIFCIYLISLKGFYIIIPLCDV